MSEDTAFIEDYKGFKKVFEKQDEEFVARNEKTETTFRDRSLYQLKGEINRSKTEAVNLVCYLATGYFDKELSKIEILSVNKVTKLMSFKILECTDKNGFDVGKTKDEPDLQKSKLLPVNAETTKAFNLIAGLEQDIVRIEARQKKELENVFDAWGGKVKL